jgi:hypothetical protein
MRPAKPRSRHLAVALFAGLVVAALALRKGTPTASVTESSTSAGIILDAGSVDAAIATASDASAPEPPPRDPPCLAQAMATLEPHASWLARFDAAPPPDKQPPPKLGDLHDLSTLPPSQLAFVRSGHLHILALPAGTERPLTTGPRDSSPQISPRGTHIAFLRKEAGDDRGYLVRADGGDLHRLSPTPTYGPLTFSSDGRYLAFSTTERDVMIHDLDTGAVQHIPGRPGEITRGPVFEPSSHRLAFTSGRELFLADAATGHTEPRELPDVVAVESIAFVPGALLISATTDYTPGGPFVVRRVPLDKPGPLAVEFLPTPLGANGVGLFASPHASRIALENSGLTRTFVPQPGGGVLTDYGDWWRRDILVYDRRRPSHETSVSRLPQPRFSLRSPAWAPDDRHLAFVADLTDKPGRNEPVARGILAVDTSSPNPAPVHVACGDSPSWGPVAPP